MTYTVAVTSQGQISIPAKWRRLLGFDKASQARVSLEKGKLILEPVADIFSLRGSLSSLSTKKPLSNAELHDLFAEAVVAERQKLPLEPYDPAAD